MSVCDHNSDECSCPFAFTDASETAQSYGCLPTSYDIVQMRIKHGKTWACHNDTSKPCVGALRYMTEQGIECKVIDPKLITEGDAWNELC